MCLTRAEHSRGLAPCSKVLSVAHRQGAFVAEEVKMSSASFSFAGG